MDTGRSSRGHGALAQVSDELRITVEGPEPLVLELPPGAEHGPDDGARRKRPTVTPLGRSAADRAEGRHRYEVVVEGWRFEVAAEPARLAELRERARRGAAEHAVHPRTFVRAQIPGRIVAVHVAAGESVEMGQSLVSIEAMKMENEVLATRAGTIERVGVAAGARVELGDELVVIG